MKAAPGTSVISLIATPALFGFSFRIDPEVQFCLRGKAPVLQEEPQCIPFEQR